MTERQRGALQCVLEYLHINERGHFLECSADGKPDMSHIYVVANELWPLVGEEKEDLEKVCREVWGTARKEPATGVGDEGIPF
jgi:hypothetical protein